MGFGIADGHEEMPRHQREESTRGRVDSSLETKGIPTPPTPPPMTCGAGTRPRVKAHGKKRIRQDDHSKCK